MTLKHAAEQALERLKTLHTEAGECSHPDECPTLLTILALEQALREEEMRLKEIRETNQMCGFGYLNQLADEHEAKVNGETLAMIGRMREHS